MICGWFHDNDFVLKNLKPTHNRAAVYCMGVDIHSVLPVHILV